jgi:alpha-L-fucosidase 2
MKNLIAALIVFACLYSCTSKNNEQNLKLWYDAPADATVDDQPQAWKDDAEWLKALPLGNGSLGVMVYGDVNQERLQLSEETMWSGSPNDDDNPDAYPAQAEIRRLLFEGKYKEATELTNKTQICKGVGSGHGSGADDPFGCFQTLGDIRINFNKKSGYENYYRELDLNDAVVRVKYSQDGVNFEREIFSSYPDKVMVAKFSADKPGQISFSCTLDRPESFIKYTDDDQVIMKGALPDGKGGVNLQYMARLKALAKNGEVKYTDGQLIVKDADEVVLYLTASTDYMLKYPEYKGRDYENISLINLNNAVKKPYRNLLRDHTEEYSQYFSRVNLDLTPGLVEEVPTNERITQFRENLNDPHLVELMFQYGRYLLISSSRPGTMPANLQGVWANKIQTPWNGDYHTDVNIEMNYWPAEVANLPEMHMPYFDLIESLVEPGSVTAEVMYRNRGWVVHPITNVWGYTSPGERASWGMHTGAGAWVCQHILEHYRFTGDVGFLERMYPVMKGSVEYYLDWLVEDPETGKLVSGPAVSPENSFIAPDGSRCQISMGPTHDQQVIRQLFNDFIDASEILEKAEMLSEVRTAEEKLLGNMIGSDGRLMEWAHEFPEAEPGHRHISHMFAVHPAALINIEETPELAAAAKKSLDYRIANGGGHTGWSAAWLISQYARLYEAENALNSLKTVLRRSTSPNMFGQHPPFQMDANFGTTAGIAEMLLQSHAGVINLLPALPEEWKTGSVKGLKARGGLEIDIEWEDGLLVEAKILSSKDSTIRIKYNEGYHEVELTAGKGYVFSL